MLYVFKCETRIKYFSVESYGEIIVENIWPLATIYIYAPIQTRHSHKKPAPQGILKLALVSSEVDLDLPMTLSHVQQRAIE